ncbi:MAG: hypothetical protein EP343_24415 [Deltaproteobacteria bacterium]|nr:MAG: hypothetical protein EP343_24415 [Deltaproteobacteria bacterium]
MTRFFRFLRALVRPAGAMADLVLLMASFALALSLYGVTFNMLGSYVKGPSPFFTRSILLAAYGFGFFLLFRFALRWFTLVSYTSRLGRLEDTLKTGTLDAKRFWEAGWWKDLLRLRPAEPDDSKSLLRPVIHQHHVVLQYNPAQRWESLSINGLGFVSSLLTALGILGTFWGINEGLQGLGAFQKLNTEGLLSTIRPLLQGMSTAFKTSILGIGAAVVFILVERLLGAILRYQYDATLQVLSRYCTLEVEEDRPVVSAPSGNFTAAAPSESFVRAMTSMERGIAVSAQCLQQMANQWQPEVMGESLAHSLQQSIQNLQQTIQERQKLALQDLTQTITLTIQRGLQESMQPLLQSLQQQSENQTKWQESLQQATTTLQDNFQQSMTEAVQPLLNTLEKQGEQHLEMQGNMRQRLQVLQSSLEQQNKNQQRQQESLQAQLRSLEVSMEQQSEKETEVQRAMLEHLATLATASQSPLEGEGEPQDLLQAVNSLAALLKDQGQVHELQQEVMQREWRSLRQSLAQATTPTPPPDAEEDSAVQMVRDLGEYVKGLQQAMDLTRQRLDAVNDQMNERWEQLEPRLEQAVTKAWSEVLPRWREEQQAALQPLQQTVETAQEQVTQHWMEVGGQLVQVGGSLEERLSTVDTQIAEAVQSAWSHTLQEWEGQLQGQIQPVVSELSAHSETLRTHQEALTSQEQTWLQLGEQLQSNQGQWEQMWQGAETALTGFTQGLEENLNSFAAKGEEQRQLALQAWEQVAEQQAEWLKQLQDESSQSRNHHDDVLLRLERMLAGPPLVAHDALEQLGEVAKDHRNLTRNLVRTMEGLNQFETTIRSSFQELQQEFRTLIADNLLTIREFQDESQEQTSAMLEKIITKLIQACEILAYRSLQLQEESSPARTEESA